MLNRFKFLMCLLALLISTDNFAQSQGAVQSKKKLQKATQEASFADLDVEHYDINLDISNFAQKQIVGYTDVRIRSNNQHDSVLFFLENLKVDSVVNQGVLLNFVHSGMRLSIAKPAMMTGDTNTFRIYYGGTPLQDATWGGFYFTGVYAYNLGVGFSANPHNFGRVWFPCVDNFTDRATFNFNITTSKENRAMCNGTLVSSDTLPNDKDKIAWHWKLRDPIPTYLASVAVAPYTVNRFEHQGIPITLSAVAKDSLDMAISFEHIPDCIDAYQQQYGPHTFERIGFNLVPFNGGAMEHATNIAYPVYGADGTNGFETLYAHELAHHWWGNTVTCRTAEDMWINEGWASFSERLFLEWVYGKKRYREDISDNHFNVVHHAHLQDGDTLPVSGISHANTYGSHVYKKGADVVHTLRGYMGDSAFFKATNSFISTFKFQDVSSKDLQDHFQKFTSVNLTNFFDNWIYNRGFPAFDVLEWKSKPVGNQYECQVRIRQRLRFAPEMFTGVPLEITAISKSFEQKTEVVMIDGSDNWFTITTPFLPQTWLIDFNEKISDAITDQSIMVRDTGSYLLKDALMNVHVSAAKDSSLVRIAHYWVAPDAWFNDNSQAILSRERYWSVDGIWSDGFKASATIDYNGRNAGSAYFSGFYDNDLIRFSEESLVLMYRPTPSSPWSVDDRHTFDYKISLFDKRGSIHINELRKGEYALATKDLNFLNVADYETNTNDLLKIYPNPATTNVSVQINGSAHSWLEVTNSNGMVMHREWIKSKKCKTEIDTSGWARGVYYIGLVIDNKPYTPKLLLVY